MELVTWDNGYGVERTAFFFLEFQGNALWGGERRTCFFFFFHRLLSSSQYHSMETLSGFKVRDLSQTDLEIKKKGGGGEIKHPGKLKLESTRTEKH